MTRPPENISIEQQQQHALLMKAIKDGDVQNVLAIIPLTDINYKMSKAMRLAVSKGDIAMVNVLLPFTDAKRGNSIALQLASIFGHRDIMEVLWDKSDAQAALRDLEIKVEFTISSDSLTLIKERLKVDEERKALGQVMISGRSKGASKL